MRLLGILTFLMLISSSFCAFVFGQIYQNNLEDLNKTLIKIEGQFSYQLVTNTSNYSIFLPEGQYTISASSFDESGNLILHTQEDIHVGSDDQQIDLVLKPAENELMLPTAILVLVFLSAIFIWSNHFWHGKSKNIEKPKTPEPLDDDAQKIMDVLTSFEGRTTQRELRDTLGFSDSKLSLILTELEAVGKIKKFKRGRGKIIKKL
ncbi:hypothetical protein KKE92_01525 [Candidatus Micrarchaeota archaeon]|nr:hypothetical protein [Candidatus Micrarchaeota archaeon]MBU1681516.1 hypothetical protein [Candidatus Micrarchaeota archaeon]